MSEFPNPQRTLVEAAMEVRLGKNVVYSDREPAQAEEIEEVVEAEETVNISNADSVVYEYLSSYFGVDLNESIDEITEEHLEEAVESLNILCAAVNEYFEIEENIYLAPEGKGKKAAKDLYKK